MFDFYKASTWLADRIGALQYRIARAKLALAKLLARLADTLDP